MAQLLILSVAAALLAGALALPFTLPGGALFQARHSQPVSG